MVLPGDQEGVGDVIKGDVSRGGAHCLDHR